jgi:hypothetical protein
MVALPGRNATVTVIFACHPVPEIVNTSPAWARSGASARDGSRIRVGVGNGCARVGSGVGIGVTPPHRPDNSMTATATIRIRPGANRLMTLTQPL